MTPDKETLVPDEENVDQVSEETLDNAGVADTVATTKETPSVDAEALKAEQARLQAENAKLQLDIRKIKSASDKQIEQIRKEAKDNERKFKQALADVQMQTMDEEARKKFEDKLVKERLQEAESEKAQTEALKDEYGRMLEGLNYFLGMGVPREKLVLNEGYNALYQSGMTALTEEITTLRAGKQPQKKTETDERKKAPNIVSRNNTAPAGGKNWADLVKEYGSEEEVYRLVQDRILPPTIIPGNKSQE